MATWNCATLCRQFRGGGAAGRGCWRDGGFHGSTSADAISAVRARVYTEAVARPGALNEGLVRLLARLTFAGILVVAAVPAWAGEVRVPFSNGLVTIAAASSCEQILPAPVDATPAPTTPTGPVKKSGTGGGQG
jgi:hypothetical protein